MSLPWQCCVFRCALCGQLYVDSFLNIFSRLLEETTATVAAETQTSLLGNLIQQRPTEEVKTWWRTATEARVCCSLPLGTNGLNKTEQVLVSFPVSHCISQDMTRYFLLSHSRGPITFWKIKGSENAIKSGRGDTGLPEPMGIQPLSTSQTLCHFHMSKWLRLFLYFSTPTSTQNNTYIVFCLQQLQLAQFPQLPYTSDTFLSTQLFTCTWTYSVTLTMEEVKLLWNIRKNKAHCML
jgi:hypothetical protein